MWKQCPLDTWLGAQQRCQVQEGRPTLVGPSQEEEGRKPRKIEFPLPKADKPPGSYNLDKRAGLLAGLEFSIEDKSHWEVTKSHTSRLPEAHLSQ